MQKFVDYEIHPIVYLGDRCVVANDPADASFWTLYGVCEDDSLMAIGDFNTEEAAKACEQRLRRS